MRDNAPTLAIARRPVPAAKAGDEPGSEPAIGGKTETVASGGFEGGGVGPPSSD